MVSMYTNTFVGESVINRVTLKKNENVCGKTILNTFLYRFKSLY